MRIIHLSDPHVSAVPDSFGALFDKRVLGAANYFLRRRFFHDDSLLAKAVDFILNDPPDAVVCTGDITSTGSPREFRSALDALAPLLEMENTRFLYVPGNHDAYVRDKRCAEALRSAFAKLNGDAFQLDDLPVKVPVGDCDFILVNEAIPTNPFHSSGHIGKEAAEKVEALAEDKGKKKRPTILVGHFPVKTARKSLGNRRGLRGPGRAILRKLLDSGALDISLCGHEHTNEIAVDDSGRGEIRAGALTRTGDLNIIEYNNEKNEFDARRVDIGC